MSRVLSAATWNVNWMSRSAESNQRKVEYLLDQRWDVVALQEVVPQLVDALAASEQIESLTYPGDLRGDRFASAIAARHGFSLSRASLIAELPQPRRGITAAVTRDNVEFDFLSWHAPNAARHADRFIKQAGYRAFTSWVAERRGPLIVGTDANHGSFYVREEDFPDSPMKTGFADDEWLLENQWWTQEDPELRDAWMQYLTEQQDALARVRATWEGGPSAISYTRGTKKRPVPDRFDYLLTSPEFSIRHVAYDYEGACRAGSDHAFLSAELALD